MSLSPGGHLVASCGGHSRANSDPEIKLWEVSSGALVRTICGQDGAVADVALSPDGRHLASAGRDKTVRLWDVFTGKQLAKFVGHEGPVNTVAFSPDGTSLASGSDDTTILLWDVARYKVSPPTVADPPLDALWADLFGRDATKAFDAVWTLAGAGDKAVAYLSAHLHPVAAPAADRLTQCVADLDAADFPARDAASRELARLGRVAEPALRKALANKPGAEVKRRIDELLNKLAMQEMTDAERREQRALLVLELIGSATAKKKIDELAKGADGAVLTSEAKAARARLR